MDKERHSGSGFPRGVLENLHNRLPPIEIPKGFCVSSVITLLGIASCSSGLSDQGELFELNRTGVYLPKVPYESTLTSEQRAEIDSALRRVIQKEATPGDEERLRQHIKLEAGYKREDYRQRASWFSNSSMIKNLAGFFAILGGLASAVAIGPLRIRRQYRLPI